MKKNFLMPVLTILLAAVVLFAASAGLSTVREENARKELEAYFADKERQTIRVYLAPGGCSGPRLVLALDEPGDEDARFEQDGFAFCINKELLQQVKSVSIDLSYLGFTVTPEVPLPSSGGSSCGGCCGSCGSHQ